MATRNGIKLLANVLFRSTYTKSKRAPIFLDGLSTQNDMSTSWQYEPLRSVTTSTATMSLAKTLRDEIAYEKENYAPIDLVKAGPPSPFTLVEEPDDTLLSLKRKFNDETISVDLTVNGQEASQQEDAVEEDEGGQLNRIVFNVTVTKKDKSLVFELESDGSDFDILHVSFEPAGGEKSESYYHGPVFEELDDNLRGDFRNFLVARGISADLGEYLRHLIHDKEQREYVSWLQKVHDFVNN